jgi:uncharacterized Zn-binding protein involved in type VI secretion
MHTCPMVTGTVPHVGGPVLPAGCPTVLIGSMPAARVGDMATCAGPPDSIVKGSATVLIGNMPAARLGDTTAHGGVITVGCPTVMIGDSGAGGGGGSGGGGGGGAGAESAESPSTAGGGGPPADGYYDDTELSVCQPGQPMQSVGTGTHWLELEMVNQAELPVAGQPYHVVLPDGKEVSGSLDGQGQVRITGIKDPGPCRIAFPELDSAAWERWQPSSGAAAGAGAGSPAPQVAPPAGSVSSDESEPSDATVPDTSRSGSGGLYHRVIQGECIASIARDHGHFWQTLWDDPANQELRARRKNPNILLPGDRVFVPDKRSKAESGNADARHKFRRKGEPSILRLRILDRADAPVAHKPFTLQVDNDVHQGTTDPQGRIEVLIAGNARRAQLVVGEGPSTRRYDITLGCVDPIDTVSGVQHRLNNLGFVCAVDGVFGPRTRKALHAFQKQQHLPETGEADDQTLRKMFEMHGS